MKKIFTIFASCLLTICFAKEITKHINTQNWRNQGGKVVTAPEGILKFVFNKKSGRYLQVRKGIRENLKDFNCLKFKIKSSTCTRTPPVFILNFA